MAQALHVRTRFSLRTHARLSLVHGKCVLGSLGPWSSRVLFFPPHLPHLLHALGPHSAEIHSLVLRLQLRDAQIPRVLGQIFGSGEARGNLGALVVV